MPQLAGYAGAAVGTLFFGADGGAGMPAPLSAADALCCVALDGDEDDVLGSPDFFACLAGGDLDGDLPLIPDVAAAGAPPQQQQQQQQPQKHLQPQPQQQQHLPPAPSSSSSGSLSEAAAELLARSATRRRAAEAAQQAEQNAAAAAAPDAADGGDRPLTKQQLAALKRKAPEVDWRSIEDPEERRRQRRLAKNRVTAARSRERKKEQLADMGDRLAELEAENAQMRALLASLAQENTEQRARLASLARGAAASPAQSRSGPEPAELECVVTMHLAAQLLDAAAPRCSVDDLLPGEARQRVVRARHSPTRPSRWRPACPALCMPLSRCSSAVTNCLSAVRRLRARQPTQCRQRR